MQTKSLLALALLSTTSLISASETTSQTVTKTITTTVAMSPSQSSKIDSALQSYYKSLTSQKQWSSVYSDINTARPTADRTASLSVFDPAITTQSWYAALPSDDRKYISSVIKAEQSIMSEGAGAAGAQPTGGVVAAAAGAAAVVGVWGLVGML